MTPSTELRTAAEKLRKLITAVPNEGWGDRPWHAEECSEEAMQCCPCIVAQGEYREFDQPQVPLIQYVADAENSEFAAYIAAMHPGVGAALAKWLGSWVGIDFNEHAAMAGDLAHALAVARQINGSRP